MLIGFAGPMRAGKSTAAMHLVVTRGFVRMSFAQPVRRDCARMLGLVEGVAPGLVEDEMRATSTKEKYRGLLQWYGVYRRTIDADHWVKHMRRRLELTLARGLSVCIDDLRFHNEVAMIRELGGKIVVLDSARSPYSQHESELDWVSMDVDAFVPNDGSVDELHEDLEELWTEWSL